MKFKMVGLNFLALLVVFGTLSVTGINAFTLENQKSLYWEITEIEEPFYIDVVEVIDYGSYIYSDFYLNIDCSNASMPKNVWINLTGIDSIIDIRVNGNPIPVAFTGKRAYYKVPPPFFKCGSTYHIQVNTTDNPVFYYIQIGSGTSTLKITEGAINQITSDTYYAELTENQANHDIIYSTLLGPYDWATEWTNAGHQAGGQRGNDVSDCVFQNATKELTDLAMIFQGTMCGSEDWEVTWSYFTDYFESNDTTAQTVGSGQGATSSTAIDAVWFAFHNQTGVEMLKTGTERYALTQEWIAMWNYTDNVGVCWVWRNDSTANLTDRSFLNTAGNMQLGNYGAGSRSFAANYSWWETRFFFFANTTTNWWEPCQNFWDAEQDSMTITATKGTDREQAKGRRYEITADANDEIEIQVAQGNTNQTNVTLILDFGKNLTNVYIYNSSTDTPTSDDLFNSFTIIEAGGNFTYNEGTAGNESTNSSTCIVSNITGKTRCYVRLGLSPDIYVIAQPLALEALFNLAVYNATDNATVEDWHVYMINGSGATFSSYTTNNTLSVNNVPAGASEVEMTIWKTGYGNATYNFSNDGATTIYYDRHLIADGFFINIGTPANNSIQFADLSFTLNITLPNYAEGNASVWYYINGTTPYTPGCHNCTGHSTSLNLRGGTHNITALINGSQHYLGVNGNTKTISVEVYTSKYNISFFDEMTNKSIDFTTKNGTLELFCADQTTRISITGNIHEYVVNCTGALSHIKFKLFDPKGNHYRTLIPTIRTGNITFYMINTTPTDTVKNLVTLAITDASLKYINGILHFKKIILGEGTKDIIDSRIGVDGNVYAYLIGEETYRLSVESEDGTDSKSLGDYTVPSATATSQALTIIDISFLPTTHSIGTDISWDMQFNTTTSRIYFYWNDSTNNTNRIQFWIWNATNMSAKTQMHYDAVNGKSNHLFQWDYVTSGSENDTYLGYFEAIHETYGNLTGSRTLTRGQIFRDFLGDIGEDWYHIVAIFMLIFIATLFGAKSAPVGAVVLAIMAGFFFHIEWIPASTGLTEVIIITIIALSILAMFRVRRRVV